MFHPFLTVQAGAPRHCLSIALALVAIKCETFTSNITNYYYTLPPFRCAARACADAVRPAALHCSMLCISELCLRPNPCGIECTDCTAQYTLPAMGVSIEPPEPPLATGLKLYANYTEGLHFSAFINPRRACAARVTVVVLSVCLSVCLSVRMYVCPNTLFWQYAQLEV